MVGRPPAIIVAPHRFTVTYEDDLADNSQACGLCGEDKQQIHIDNDLGPTVERETVLHEVMHAIWHQTELDRKFKDSDEEMVAWTLAPRLLALLRDNEELVRWLMSDD